MNCCRQAMNLNKDYYTILGVARNVKTAELKNAFRRLAVSCHPDHHPGDRAAEERFKELSEAYGILNSPEKRARYDRLRQARWQPTSSFAAARPGAKAAFRPRPSTWETSPPPPRPPKPKPSARLRPQPPSGRRPGPDYDEQVLAGLKPPFFKNLPRVEGGWRSWLKKVKHRLAGLAEDWGLWQETSQTEVWDLRYNLALSPEAARKGVEVLFRHLVNGQPRELLIKVPPGIKSGTLLRLSGQGESGPSGRQGDLLLEIMIKPR